MEGDFLKADIDVSGGSDLLKLGSYGGLSIIRISTLTPRSILTPRELLERVGEAPGEQSRARALLSPVVLQAVVFQDERPSEMLVAEVTTTDLRKTRYQVESKDDIRKTRQGYKIETAGGETACFSEEDVESISVVEE